MRYFKITLSVIAILFTGRVAYSQENFRPGYIITNNNDTLYGSIQYKGARQSALKCTFIANNSGVIEDYEPGQISGYRYTEGKYFISRSVDQNGTMNMVFLEFLIKGKANIYALSDNEGSRFFIETEKDGFVELSEPPRILKTDSGTFYAPDRYNGKLLYLLADCPQIVPKINKVKLQPKPLISLAKEYHNQVCPDEICTVFERKIKPIKFGISIHGGPVINNINFGNKVESDNRTGYSAGISLKISNIFISDERFHIETGITLISNNTFRFKTTKNNTLPEKVLYMNKAYYLNHYEEFYLSDQYIKVKSLEVNTQLSSISIPLTVNYTYPAKKLRPAIGLGAVFSFVTSQNDDLKYEFFSNRFGKTFPPRMVGYIVNASLKYRTGPKSSIELDVRYIRQSSFFDTNKLYRLRANTLIAQLRYNFYW